MNCDTDAPGESHVPTDSERGPIPAGLFESAANRFADSTAFRTVVPTWSRRNFCKYDGHHAIRTKGTFDVVVSYHASSGSGGSQQHFCGPGAYTTAIVSVQLVLKPRPLTQ